MSNPNKNVPRFGYCFLWTIENYRYAFKKDSDCIGSPVFTISELHKTRWQVICNPRSVWEGSIVKCYLRRLSDKGPRIMTINFEAQMVTSDQENPLVRATFNKTFEMNHIVGSFELRRSSKNLAGTSRGSPNNNINSKESNSNLIVRVLIWQSPNNFSSLRKCFARTCVGIEENFFHLTMGDSSRSLEGRRRKITILSPLNLPIITLGIAVSNGYFDMDVNAQNFKREILAWINLRVMNFNGSVYSNREHSIVFNPDSLEANIRNISYPSNSALIINCNLVISVGIISSKLENLEGDLVVKGTSPLFVSDVEIVDVTAQIEPQNILLRDLSNDLQQLLKEGTLSDKALRTGENNFAIHKSILCARSPIFKEKFTTNMEKNSLRDISDIDEDTMRRLLLFMYTDKVPDLDTNSAIKLYAAADRYSVELLKQKCSWFLQENLVPKSPCSVLVLADSHSDQELKDFVKRFILAHDKEVVNSDAWKLFLKQQPRLATEVLSLKWQ